MTAIHVATFIRYGRGGAQIAEGLPEERIVRTEAALAALPAGTIIIDADECTAVAVGDGTFSDNGLDGSFPAPGSVVLPGYIIAGPGLPVLIPGEATTLQSQDAADANYFDFRGIDAEGTLLLWEPSEGSHLDFRWYAPGKTEPVDAVFPVTAWC